MQEKDGVRSEIADLENSIKLVESEVAELNSKISAKKIEFAKQNEVSL